MSTRTTPSQCPHCFKLLDAASYYGATEGAKPKAGNWTICAYCCNVLRFTDTGGVRAIDEMERATLEQSPDWPEFQRLIDGLKQLKRERRQR